MADHEFGFETLCLHAGQIPDAQTGSRALPIYQTTSCCLRAREHAASLFNLADVRQRVHAAARIPTTAVFEERSGGAGERPRGGGHGFGPGRGDGRFPEHPREGRPRRLVGEAVRRDIHDARSELREVRHRVHAGRSRRPGEFPQGDRSPTPRRSSRRRWAIPAINVVRHRGGGEDRRTRRAFHSSWTTPRLRRTCASPFEHGADIVVHSATKFLGGHGTTMGGVGRRKRKVPVGQRQSFPR